LDEDQGTEEGFTFAGILRCVERFFQRDVWW